MFPPLHKTGFTVLEILVAMTIFTIVAVVVFTVFGGAMRTQRIAERETLMLESARYALDQFERDLTNIIIRDETSYNEVANQLITQMERDRVQAEANNDWESFFNNYGDPNDPDNEGTVGNPYEQARIIDLQMSGENAGATDTITFVVHRPLEAGGTYWPMGLTRIKYSVQKGMLIRSEDTVEAQERDVFGEVVGQPVIPGYARLAENVRTFDLRYAFWYDNQWYEVESWDSTSRSIRNPRTIYGDYEREEQEERDWRQTVLPGDAGWNDFIADQTVSPLDRLPAAIRLTLTLAADADSERTATYRRIFRLFPSEETWTPWDELTEEERENERALRDERFQLIFPGALEEY